MLDARSGGGPPAFLRSPGSDLHRRTLQLTELVGMSLVDVDVLGTRCTSAGRLAAGSTTSTQSSCATSSATPPAPPTATADFQTKPRTWAQSSSTWPPEYPYNRSRRSNYFSELEHCLRNRTVNLLLTMHAGFVRWCRAGSDYRRLGGYRRLGASRCVGCCLGSLSLGLSLAWWLPVGSGIFYRNPHRGRAC